MLFLFAAGDLSLWPSDRLLPLFDFRLNLLLASIEQMGLQTLGSLPSLSLVGTLGGQIPLRQSPIWRFLIASASYSCCFHVGRIMLAFALMLFSGRLPERAV